MACVISANRIWAYQLAGSNSFLLMITKGQLPRQLAFCYTVGFKLSNILKRAIAIRGLRKLIIPN